MSTKQHTALSDYFCDCCGNFMPDGTSRNVVHIQILSDIEGIVLFEDEGMSAEDKAEHLPAVLEDELLQEQTYILCGSCKQKFALDPFNRGPNFTGKPKKIERLFN